MTNATKVFTVAATATALWDTANTGPTPAEDYCLVIQLPAGSADVFIGGPAVTTSTGLKLSAGDPPFALDQRRGEIVYAIVASSTQAVTVLFEGV